MNSLGNTMVEEDILMLLVELIKKSDLNKVINELIKNFRSFCSV